MGTIRDAATAVADRIQRSLHQHPTGSVVSIIEGANRFAGVKRGTQELIAAYRTSPWFRAVVSKIATKVASVRWNVSVRTDRSGRRIRSQTWAMGLDPDNRKELTKLHESGRLTQLDDHPLLTLLATANPSMTGLIASKVTQSYLDIKGESFWLLEFGPNGQVVEYWPIPPHWVTETPTAERNRFTLAIQGRNILVEPESIIWLREPNLSNPYSRGSGVGESLEDEIETDSYIAQFIKGVYLNRGRPDIVVAVEGASESALKKAKAEFENDYRGLFKGARSFWHRGKMTIQTLAQDLQSMEMTKTRSWERDLFISVYGVPPELLGVLGESNRATIREARSIMATEVVIPRLEFLRTEWQARLVPLFNDPSLVVWYDDPRPDDQEQRREWAKIAPWALTRAEFRREMGQDDRGDMDNVHFVPIQQLPQKPEFAIAQGSAHRDEEENARRLRRAKPISDVKQMPLFPAPAARTKVLTQGEIDLISEIPQATTIRTHTDQVWPGELQAWGNQTLEDLGLDPSFTLLNPLVAAHLEDFSSTRITAINATTRKQVRERLAAGVLAGEGIEQLADRLDGIFGPQRTLTIARTETLRSANFGTWGALKSSGVVGAKEWVTTLDGFQRDAHDDLDEVVVGIDEPFVSEGNTAMHPGGFGVPELDINCRCAVTAALTDAPARSADNRAGVWKQFDTRVRTWEQLATNAFERALREQQSEVLAALRKLR